MIDPQLVKNKMADIQGYFAELNSLLREEVRTLIDNNLKLHSVERLFQRHINPSSATPHKVALLWAYKNGERIKVSL